MKVAYLSVYEDGTGYSHAALGYILALEAAGLDVVCRPISMTPKNGREEARAVRHLESKSLDGVDVVIQHCLPHTFERKAGVFNVGMFAWETSDFNRSTWADHCNMMDQIWVPCQQNYHAARNSGVAVPIRVVPHALDINRFAKDPPVLGIPGTRGKLVFYTIGENIRRKNYAGLLRAYFSAFSRDDDVVLVIKTSTPGASPQQTVDQFGTMIKDIQSAIHVYPDPSHYPPVVVIANRLSDTAIDQLHALGDVFVSLSHGEAWCLPAAHAMACGNPLIASNWGAFPDLMGTEFGPRIEWTQATNAGRLVGGQLVPCFCPDAAFPVLYTGQEEWFDPNLASARYSMQMFYAAWQNVQLDGMRRNAISQASRFSYAAVGDIARKALEE